MSSKWPISKLVLTEHLTNFNKNEEGRPSKAWLTTFKWINDTHQLVRDNLAPAFSLNIIRWIVAQVGEKAVDVIWGNLKMLVSHKYTTIMPNCQL